MTKFGQVSKYNEAKGTVTVRFSRPEACQKCGACGAGVQNGSVTLKAEGCNVGDWVRVELPEGRFLSATALAYGLPLAGMFLGLGLGYLLGRGGDIAMLLGALGGVAVAVAGLYLVDRRIAGRPEWTPRITAVYGELPDIAQIGCRPE